MKDKIQDNMNQKLYSETNEGENFEKYSTLFANSLGVYFVKLGSKSNISKKYIVEKINNRTDTDEVSKKKYYLSPVKKFLSDVQEVEFENELKRIMESLKKISSRKKVSDVTLLVPFCRMVTSNILMTTFFAQIKIKGTFYGIIIENLHKNIQCGICKIDDAIYMSYFLGYRYGEFFNKGTYSNDKFSREAHFTSYCLGILFHKIFSYKLDYDNYSQLLVYYNPPICSTVSQKFSSQYSDPEEFLSKSTGYSVFNFNQLSTVYTYTEVVFDSLEFLVSLLECKHNNERIDFLEDFTAEKNFNLVNTTKYIRFGVSSKKGFYIETK